MIHNYLDYVKSQRKDALKAVRGYRESALHESSRWGQGFYAGHSQARYFEARHWRRLQKDIESHNEGGEALVYMPMYG